MYLDCTHLASSSTGQRGSRSMQKNLQWRDWRASHITHIFCVASPCCSILIFMKMNIMLRESSAKQKSFQFRDIVSYPLSAQRTKVHALCQRHHKQNLTTYILILFFCFILHPGNTGTVKLYSIQMRFACTFKKDVKLLYHVHLKWSQ